MGVGVGEGVSQRGKLLAAVNRVAKVRAQGEGDSSRKSICVVGFVLSCFRATFVVVLLPLPRPSCSPSLSSWSTIILELLMTATCPVPLIPLLSFLGCLFFLSSKNEFAPSHFARRQLIISQGRGRGVAGLGKLHELLQRLLSSRTVLLDRMCRGERVLLSRTYPSASSPRGD